MKLAQKFKANIRIENWDINYIAHITSQSFRNIAPYWPLKNLIAVNPLQGLEDLPFDQALDIANVYFEQKEIPEEMEEVNRETIKWLQAYLDEGQATLAMPLRAKGLYSAWRKLALYDVKLHNNDKRKRDWLKNIPTNPELAIYECLQYLDIAKEHHIQFLTLLLTTLPGWAAYIKYRTEWVASKSAYPYPVSQVDYLAIRLIITSLLWTKAKKLMDWYKNSLNRAEKRISMLKKIEKLENDYRMPMLKKLAVQSLKERPMPKAQFVFCIDVRSEPFRHVLESIGDYQTFGFAGFFGIPVQIVNTVTNESYASCPVLLSPKHTVRESPSSYQACSEDLKGYKRITGFIRLYQAAKYTFTSPFGLVESIGIINGIWMGLRCLAPQVASKLKDTLLKTVCKPHSMEPSLENINFKDQCEYAQKALQMIGLTSSFSPIVIFCGHGSSTQNNAYATALNCGACGGRHGSSNAQILAKILNRSEIRTALREKGIDIPKTTRFISAVHNTTTDEMTLYASPDAKMVELKIDLEKARMLNSYFRISQLEKKLKVADAEHSTRLRSLDWAEVRPEWGLARNAAFIVAPREITSDINLEGRCFLHSYDYKQDPDGNFLTTILTAPMIVAQWINAQYLFSTLNNVAYGSGSKITKNNTGKIGIMQGNASDLMTGLPLQSVYKNDIEPYHEPQRLMTVVFAPLQMLDKIIHTQPILQRLFGNLWVQLVCIQPNNREIFFLNRDFTWRSMK